jgi:hypothetical protein
MRESFIKAQPFERCPDSCVNRRRRNSASVKGRGHVETDKLKATISGRPGSRDQSPSQEQPRGTNLSLVTPPVDHRFMRGRH